VWEETASRERVVAEWSRTINEGTAEPGRLLEEREQESARIDARGLPVVGFGILLSGVPDELAAIPFPFGWALPAVGVGAAAVAIGHWWRERRRRMG
jgi:hypothetical protein